MALDAKYILKCNACNYERNAIGITMEQINGDPPYLHCPKCSNHLYIAMRIVSPPTYDRHDNVEEEEEIVEALADYAHNAWAGWMQYMFERSSWGEDGTIIIPAKLVSRWTRQLLTKYENLSESEKASDRIEARKIMEIARKLNKFTCNSTG